MPVASRRLVVFAALSACIAEPTSSSVTPVEAPTAEDPVAVVPAQPEPEPAPEPEPEPDPEPTPCTLADDLAKLDPSAPDFSPRAIDLYLANHTAERCSERDRRADLVGLLKSLEDHAVAAAAKDLATDASLLAAACRETKRCDAGEPTAEAVAWVAAQKERAVVILYAGEGTVEPKVDALAVRDRLRPVLSVISANYLTARAGRDLMLSHHDEGGFDGDPEALATALVVCENLGYSKDAYYAGFGQGCEGGLAWDYLTMPVADLGPRKIKIPKQHRESWERFTRERRNRSRWVAAVAHHLEALKKIGFAGTAEQLQEIAKDSLTHATASP